MNENVEKNDSKNPVKLSVTLQNSNHEITLGVGGNKKIFAAAVK